MKYSKRILLFTLVVLFVNCFISGARAEDAEEEAKKIIKICSGLDGRDFRGRTPLQRAVALGKAGVVAALIKMGAEIKIKSRYNRSLLHVVAKKDVAEVLLSNGLGLNAKDLVGKTPLHCAAENGKEGVVAFLLEKGAAVNAVDRRGKTPLDVVKTAMMSRKLKDSIISLIEKKRSAVKSGSPLGDEKKYMAEMSFSMGMPPA